MVVSLVKIISWNINKKPNEKYVYDLIKENSIDVIFLIEANTFSTETFKNNDKANEYKIIDKLCKNENFLCIAKNIITIENVTVHKRFETYRIIINENLCLVTVVHLESKNNGETKALVDHGTTICNIKEDIKGMKEKYNIDKSFILGDFNCNPFETEMVAYNCFNSTLFKDIIEEQSITKHEDIAYERLYNPIITILNENTKNYGSIYRSDQVSIIWHSFDQVLFDINMMKLYETGEFIKTIGSVSLINKCKPNTSISDHLPLLIKFS